MDVVQMLKSVEMKYESKNFPTGETNIYEMARDCRREIEYLRGQLETKAKGTVKINVDSGELDIAIEKAQHLREELEKAGLLIEQINKPILGSGADR